MLGIWTIASYTTFCTTRLRRTRRINFSTPSRTLPLIKLSQTARGREARISCRLRGSVGKGRNTSLFGQQEKYRKGYAMSITPIVEVQECQLRQDKSSLVPKMNGLRVPSDVSVAALQYVTECRHQALDRQNPDAVYFARADQAEAA